VKRKREKNLHHNSLLHVFASDKMDNECYLRFNTIQVRKEKKIYGELNP